MPPLDLLRADGGMTRNRWLMQFQADVLGIPVETAREPEQTALGAALLALGERTAFAGGRAIRAARERRPLRLARRAPPDSQPSLTSVLRDLGRSRRLLHPTERSTACRYQRHW